MCNNTLMSINLGINYSFFFFSPVLIINYRHILSTGIIIFKIIIIFHILITTAFNILSIVMLVRVIMWVILVLTWYWWMILDRLWVVILYMILFIKIFYLKSWIESFEYHISVLRLHKTLINILHNAWWIWVYNANVMHTSTWNLYNLSVHKRLDKLW